MTAEQYVFARETLGRIAILHQRATKDDQRLLEHLAEAIANHSDYPYSSMRLHLASMWPKELL